MDTPKPSKQQNKKMKNALKNFVQDSYEISQEILAEIENSTDKFHWKAYANLNCNVCYGRGTNEISHPNHQINRVVPCDCALRNRRKEESFESKPMYGVDNGKKTLFYQKTKNDKFLVPEGWEKAEKVFV